MRIALSGDRGLLVARHEFAFPSAHPGAVRSCAVLTVALAISAIVRERRIEPRHHFSDHLVYSPEPQPRENQLRLREAHAEQRLAGNVRFCVHDHYYSNVLNADLARFGYSYALTWKFFGYNLGGNVHSA